MCDGDEGCCCSAPVKRKKPEDCTPEQIRECHGEVEEHPCEEITGKTE